MTTLAQLHDCHSCYDERSIDQKKAGSLFALALPMIFWCLSYVHPMLLVSPTSPNAWPTDYFTIWSLGTLMLMYFVCNLCSSLSGRVDNDTTRIFTERRAME